MSTIPARGEVWLIDFGFAGKTRPALVVSVAFGGEDRSLITVVPHTTSLRGYPFEIGVSVPFLKAGGFSFRVSPPFRRYGRCIASGGCAQKRSQRSSMAYCVGSGT